MQQPRILDVNLNRLTESLKYIEDYIRFSLADQTALRKIRNLRRDFLMLKRILPLSEIVAARRSQVDLGRDFSFDKNERKSVVDVVNANFSRAKESLRIIEEIMKLNTMDSSRHAKEMRFRVYDLEKSVLDIQRRRFDPRLCIIIDEKYLGTIDVQRTVDILIHAGVTMIQLRIKTLHDREYYSWARKMRQWVSNPGTKLIINDRPDIATLSGADGVHVGQDDLPVREVRNMLGENYIIGASVHGFEQARRAIAEGADYLGVGAVYKTTTKGDAVICGIEKLRQLCKSVSVPVIGIGGINAANYRSVIRAGAAGIAVSSFVCEGDVKKNIRALTGVRKWL